MASPLLSSLGVVCPACDHYNVPLSGRCSGCAGDLDAEVAVSKDARSPSERATGNPAASRVLADAPLPPGMRPGARVAPSQDPAVAPKWGITVLLGQQAGQRFRLGGAGCLIGRTRGAVLFSEDPYVSPVHATLIIKDDRLFIRDDGSVSGVFISIAGQSSLAAFDFFAVGSRLFRYLGPLDPVAPPRPNEPSIYGAPVPAGQIMFGIEEILAGARSGRSVVTPGPLFTIGHKACDWTLSDDADVSPRHCEIQTSRTQTVLRDLSGTKGTFLRIAPGKEHAIQSGDRIRIGLQTLKVDSLA